MERKDVGERLRKARIARGCSVQELAPLVSLRPNYLHEIERGSKLPSLDSLRRLCRVLGVTSDWVLGLTRAGGPSKRVPD